MRISCLVPSFAALATLVVALAFASGALDRPPSATTLDIPEGPLVALAPGQQGYIHGITRNGHLVTIDAKRMKVIHRKRLNGLGGVEAFHTLPGGKEALIWDADQSSLRTILLPTGFTQCERSLRRSQPNALPEEFRFAIAPGTGRIALSESNGPIQIFDPQNLTLIQTLQLPSAGEPVVETGDPTAPTRWDMARSHGPSWEGIRVERWLSALAFSHDGRFLAFTLSTGTIGYWDMEHLQPKGWVLVEVQSPGDLWPRQNGIPRHRIPMLLFNPARSQAALHPQELMDRGKVSTLTQGFLNLDTAHAEALPTAEDTLRLLAFDSQGALLTFSDPGNLEAWVPGPARLKGQIRLPLESRPNHCLPSPDGRWGVLRMDSADGFRMIRLDWTKRAATRLYRLQPAASREPGFWQGKAFFQIGAKGNLIRWTQPWL